MIIFITCVDLDFEKTSQAVRMEGGSSFAGSENVTSQPRIHGESRVCEGECSTGMA